MGGAHADVAIQAYKWPHSTLCDYETRGHHLHPVNLTFQGTFMAFFFHRPVYFSSQIIMRSNQEIAQLVMKRNLESPDSWSLCHRLCLGRSPFTGIEAV